LDLTLLKKFANSKLVEGISKNRLTKYLIRTSQALDIINGGEKANALPEHVKLLVNHRVAIGTSVAEVQENFVSRVVEVAKRHGLLLVKMFSKLKMIRVCLMLPTLLGS